MLLSRYIFPLYNTPEAGGGAAAPTPTPTAALEPASGALEPAAGAEGEPADAGFDKILEAFQQNEPDDVDEPPSSTPAAPAEPGAQAPGAPPPSPTPAAAPVPASPVGAPSPAGVQTAVPAVAPAPTPVVAPASPPAQPAVASVPSPAPAATPPVAAAPTPTQNFSEIAEGLKKSKAELVKAVAEQNYVLSDQDLEEFASDPRKVIGRVAAAAQIETTASVMKVLSEHLPVVVYGLIEAHRQNDRAEDAFWAANKHLDRTKHRAETLQTYQQLRALHPNMAQDEAIRQVGQWMALKHGIPYLPGGNGQVQAPAAPQVVHTPGPVVRTPAPGGFIPAAPAAAPASAQPRPPQTPFDRFFDTFVLDERGAFENE